MSENWDEHITVMKQEGTWATQVELYAIASYFQIPLYLCSPHPATKKYTWLLLDPYDQDQLIFEQNHEPHNL